MHDTAPRVRQVSVYMPDDLRRRLRIAAARMDTSITELVCRCVRECLPALEAAADRQEQEVRDAGQ